MKRSEMLKEAIVFGLKCYFMAKIVKFLSYYVQNGGNINAF